MCSRLVMLCHSMSEQVFIDLRVVTSTWGAGKGILLSLNCNQTAITSQ